MLRGRPSDVYRHRVRAGVLRDDERQRQLLGHLDEIYFSVYRHIRHRNSPAPLRWARRMLGRLARTLAPRPGAAAPVAVAGLYLHGEVGRGKSQLMNILRQSLPESYCAYHHYHALMATVHQHLRDLAQEADPLEQVAERILGERLILFVDEFVVIDIADAMLMSGLLDALLARKAILVATSNFAPADLYRGGLQRARFEPAVALIESRLRVFELGAGIDHRRQKLSRRPIFAIDSGTSATASLAEIFVDLADARPRAQSIKLADRRIDALAAANGVAWFRFGALCGHGRSRHDYHELAMVYPLIIIDGLEAMDDSDNERARRLIHLIDILYENKVKIIARSSAPIDGLYQGERLGEEFKRTASRLVEMCTDDWMARPHFDASAAADKANSDQAKVPAESLPASESVAPA